MGITGRDKVLTIRSLWVICYERKVKLELMLSCPSRAKTGIILR